MIYWGSWDGNEHATNRNGAQVWQTGLGYTYSSQCDDLVGVASTATIATVGIGGKSTPVVFVGGGNASSYALNGNTGAIIWQTSLGTSPDNFIWSSPVYYRGSIYIGLASLGDCPLVQGKLFRLNATTGAIRNTFNVVFLGAQVVEYGVLQLLIRAMVACISLREILVHAQSTNLMQLPWSK